MAGDRENEDVQSFSTKKEKQKPDVFRLWVKLKIPKEERRQEEDECTDIINGDQKIGFRNEDQMKSNDDGKRVCGICEKAFSSGKALGGHMRIHVQRSHIIKNRVFQKKLLKVHNHPREDHDRKVIGSVKKKKKKIINRFGDDSGKPICVICGKGFPSMKSLFGHMRCHPERDWRGINPPSSSSSSPSSSSSSSLSEAEPPRTDDDDDGMEVLASGTDESINGNIVNRGVDLMDSLKGWSMTARRGRKATSAVATSADLTSSDEDQLHDAVNYLMMLAHGASSFENIKMANSFCKSEILDINNFSKLKRPLIERSNSPTKQLIRNECEKGHTNCEAGKSVLVRGGEPVNKMEGREWVDHHHHDRISGVDQIIDSKRDFKAGIMIKNKKRIRKKMKLCDLKLTQNSPSSPVENNNKYKCNTCDKFFPTHQALGGHSSSHKKPDKISFVNRSAMRENHDHNLYNPTVQVEEKAKELNERGSSLNLTSNKDFSTADCDDNGRVEAEPSNRAMSADEASCIGGRGLEIDLNEEPPLEDI